MNKIKYDVQKDIRSSGVSWYVYVLVGLITTLVGIAIVALIMTVLTLYETQEGVDKEADRLRKKVSELLKKKQ